VKLIHISDIHINAEPILGSDPIEKFNACIDHVERHHDDADMVIISGDLTHHGQKSAYETLTRLLRDRSISPLLILGNHDHRPTFCETFPNVPADENGFIQYSKDTPMGRFLFLDTAEIGTHAGHYCNKRQAWNVSELERAEQEGMFVYLVMHHNPVDVGVVNADAIGLVDGSVFREILSQYQITIRHIFFGHCHYILSGSACGISFSAPRSTNHPCVPDFSGENRLGFGNFPVTYNVCLLSEDATVVHSIDFMNENDVTWLETTSDGWIKESVPEPA